MQQRTRELELLNRAGQTLTSTLDLDQVLGTVREEVRHLLDKATFPTLPSSAQER